MALSEPECRMPNLGFHMLILNKWRCHEKEGSLFTRRKAEHELVETINIVSSGSQASGMPDPEWF